jgi:hypothetical protein
MNIKTIPNFPAYRISENGILETCWQWGAYYPGMNKPKKWKKLLPKYDKKGYSQVTLCDVDGKHKRISLHRLMAEIFISPMPFEKACVRHLDGNPKNNKLSNLTWGTYKENEDDKILHGTWNTRNGGAKITSEQVREIRIKLDNGESQKELSIEYGVSRPTITRISNNKIWKNL